MLEIEGIAHPAGRARRGREGVRVRQGSVPAADPGSGIVAQAARYAMSRYRLSFCALLAVSAALFAQSSGTLTGIITDPSQSNLPGVLLILTNEETGVAERASSNAQGEYTFPLLQPGRYRLTVEAAGFRPYTRTGIVLESARVGRLDVRMALRQVNEAVEVKA